MTNRQKIAHLLRRFGLGASPKELDLFEPFGVEGAINRLIDYENTPPGFQLNPWTLCWEPESDDVYLDAFRPALWWGLRMLFTERPLEERLALFWHDHFAVGANKVEFGPAMLSYLRTLYRHGGGSFGTLLEAVSKEPAMVRFLDLDASLAGTPNENFARELLELFTVGPGAYTEKDISETARAFTGWGIRYLAFERGAENVQPRMKELIQQNRYGIAFAFSPTLHDPTPKTILGQRVSSGEDVLSMLAGRPETARFIAKKLWEYFAYEKPEEAVVARLAKVYMENDGAIKPMLRAIAKSDEFWSERCVRRKIKDPIDFVVPILRQFDIGAILQQLAGPHDDPMKPAAKPLRDIGGLVVGSTYKQGMLPLFPPDVGGWPRGEAWITSNIMVERMNFAEPMFGPSQKEHPLAPWLSLQLGVGTATTADLVRRFLERFDAEIPAEKAAQMVVEAERQGGVAALAKPETAAPLFHSLFRLMLGLPEFQLC
jgi:uncharacterized protein (DUF1800 family)